MKALIIPAYYRDLWIFPRVQIISYIIALFILLQPAEIIYLSTSLPKTPSISYQSEPTVTPSTHTTEIASLGQQYMDALLQQKYTAMWSMLHPQIQATWHDQATFAHYLQTRFENYTLQHFSFGTVGHLSSWINPETMVEYKDVEIMPISLQLVSRLTPQQQAQLAPQFQRPDHLLQNIPLIVQHVTSQSKEANNQWLILKSGPADLEAPLLPPPNPVNKALAVPILMYHYISGVPTNDPNPRLRQSLSVSPQLFNQELDYLKRQGFHSITLNQLMNALYYGVSLPSQPII